MSGIFISSVNKKKIKENDIVDAIDYHIPVTQLRGVRWSWIYAAKRLFTIAHPATARFFTFFMNGPISKIFGMKIDIIKKKITFTLLQNLQSS